MFNSLFKKSLTDILPKVRGKYLKNVPLSKHTWFGVGGPAEVMFIPEDKEDLSINAGFLMKPAFFIDNERFI